MEVAVVRHNMIDDLKQLTKFGLSLSVVFSSIAGYLLAADIVDFKTLFLLSNLFTQNNKGNYHASNTGNRPKKEGDVG